MNQTINPSRRAMLTSVALAAAVMAAPLAQAQATKVLKLGSILTLTGPSLDRQGRPGRRRVRGQAGERGRRRAHRR